MALPRNVHSKLTTSLSLVVLAWVVQVVGLIFLQRSCKEHHGAGWKPAAHFPGVPSCSKMYRWEWWCVFVELPIVVGLASSLLGWSGSSFNNIARFRFSWIGLLAIATVLQMWGANTALNLTDASLVGDTERTRAWVVFAGFVVAAATNFIMIFVLGDEGDTAVGRDPLLAPGEADV